MTRSRRGRGGHGGGGGGGGGHGGGDSRWLVTYADLLTLLMVLFLVLWVISTIDLKKFEEFKSGLGDFGNKTASAAAPTEAAPDPNGDVPNTSTTLDSEPATTLAPGEAGAGGDGTGGPLDADQLAGMVGQLDTVIDSSGLGDVVDVHVEERGLVVSISTDNVLFPSGSDSLTTAGADIIGKVAPQLAALQNDMIVEGYTDKRPLHREGYDNWDLSVDRAVSVLKVLRDEYGFSPNQLAATGYGDQDPIAEGDDEASLARNRRVEIVIIAGPTT